MGEKDFSNDSLKEALKAGGFTESKSEVEPKPESVGAAARKFADSSAEKKDTVSKKTPQKISRSGKKLVDETAVIKEIDRLDKIEKENDADVEYSEENGFYFSKKAIEEYEKSVGNKEALAKYSAFENRINDIIAEKRKKGETFDKMQLVLDELKKESPRLHAILTEELVAKKKKGPKKSEELERAEDAIKTIKGSKLEKLKKGEIPENFGKIKIDESSYLDANKETTLYKAGELNPGEEGSVEKIKKAANEELWKEFDNQKKNQEKKKKKEADEKIVAELRAKYPGKIEHENPNGDKIVLKEVSEGGMVHYDFKKKGARKFTEGEIPVYELDKFMQDFKPVPEKEEKPKKTAEKSTEKPTVDSAAEPASVEAPTDKKTEAEAEFTPEEMIKITEIREIISPTLKAIDEFDYLDSGYDQADIPETKKSEKNRAWNNFGKEVLKRNIFADEKRASQAIEYLKNQL